MSRFAGSRLRGDGDKGEHEDGDAERRGETDCAPPRLSGDAQPAFAFSAPSAHSNGSIKRENVSGMMEPTTCVSSVTDGREDLTRGEGAYAAADTPAECGSARLRDAEDDMDVVMTEAFADAPLICGAPGSPRDSGPLPVDAGGARDAGSFALSAHDAASPDDSASASAALRGEGEEASAAEPDAHAAPAQSAEEAEEGGRSVSSFFFQHLRTAAAGREEGRCASELEGSAASDAMDAGAAAEERHADGGAPVALGRGDAACETACGEFAARAKEDAQAPSGEGEEASATAGVESAPRDASPHAQEVPVAGANDGAPPPPASASCTAADAEEDMGGGGEASAESSLASRRGSRSERKVRGRRSSEKREEDREEEEEERRRRPEEEEAELLRYHSDIPEDVREGRWCTKAATHYMHLKVLIYLHFLVYLDRGFVRSASANEDGQEEDLSPPHPSINADSPFLFDLADPLRPSFSTLSLLDLFNSMLARYGGRSQLSLSKSTPQCRLRPSHAFAHCQEFPLRAFHCLEMRAFASHPRSRLASLSRILSVCPFLASGNLPFAVGIVAKHPLCGFPSPEGEGTAHLSPQLHRVQPLPLLSLLAWHFACASASSAVLFRAPLHGLAIGCVCLCRYGAAAVEGVCAFLTCDAGFLHYVRCHFLRDCLKAARDEEEERRRREQGDEVSTEEEDDDRHRGEGRRRSEKRRRSSSGVASREDEGEEQCDSSVFSSLSSSSSSEDEGSCAASPTSSPPPFSAFPPIDSPLFPALPVSPEPQPRGRALGGRRAPVVCELLHASDPVKCCCRLARAAEDDDGGKARKRRGGRQGSGSSGVARALPLLQSAFECEDLHLPPPLPASFRRYVPPQCFPTLPASVSRGEEGEEASGASARRVGGDDEAAALTIALSFTTRDLLRRSYTVYDFFVTAFSEGLPAFFRNDCPLSCVSSSSFHDWCYRLPRPSLSPGLLPTFLPSPITAGGAAQRAEAGDRAHDLDALEHDDAAAAPDQGTYLARHTSFEGGCMVNFMLPGETPASILFCHLLDAFAGIAAASLCRGLHPEFASATTNVYHIVKVLELFIFARSGSLDRLPPHVTCALPRRWKHLLDFTPLEKAPARVGSRGGARAAPPREAQREVDGRRGGTAGADGGASFEGAGEARTTQGDEEGRQPRDAHAEEARDGRKDGEHGEQEPGAETFTPEERREFPGGEEEEETAASVNDRRSADAATERRGEVAGAEEAEEENGEPPLLSLPLVMAHLLFTIHHPASQELFLRLLGSNSASGSPISAACFHALLSGLQWPVLLSTSLREASCQTRVDALLRAENLLRLEQKVLARRRRGAARVRERARSRSASRRAWSPAFSPTFLLASSSSSSSSRRLASSPSTLSPSASSFFSLSPLQRRAADAPRLANSSRDDRALPLTPLSFASLASSPVASSSSLPPPRASAAPARAVSPSPRWRSTRLAGSGRRAASDGGPCTCASPYPAFQPQGPRECCRRCGLYFDGFFSKRALAGEPETAGEPERDSRRETAARDDLRRRIPSLYSVASSPSSASSGAAAASASCGLAGAAQSSVDADGPPPRERSGGDASAGAARRSAAPPLLGWRVFRCGTRAWRRRLLTLFVVAGREFQSLKASWTSRQRRRGGGSLASAHFACAEKRGKSDADSARGKDEGEEDFLTAAALRFPAWLWCAQDDRGGHLNPPEDGGAPPTSPRASRLGSAAHSRSHSRRRRGKGAKKVASVGSARHDGGASGDGSDATPSRWLRAPRKHHRRRSASPSLPSSAPDVASSAAAATLPPACEAGREKAALFHPLLGSAPTASSLSGSSGESLSSEGRHLTALPLVSRSQGALEDKEREAEMEGGSEAAAASSSSAACSAAALSPPGACGGGSRPHSSSLCLPLPEAAQGGRARSAAASHAPPGLPQRPHGLHVASRKAAPKIHVLQSSRCQYRQNAHSLAALAARGFFLFGTLGLTPQQLQHRHAVRRLHLEFPYLFLSDDEAGPTRARRDRARAAQDESFSGAEDARGSPRRRHSSAAESEEAEAVEATQFVPVHDEARDAKLPLHFALWREFVERRQKLERRRRRERLRREKEMRREEEEIAARKKKKAQKKTKHEGREGTRSRAHHAAARAQLAQGDAEGQRADDAPAARAEDGEDEEAHASADDEESNAPCGLAAEPAWLRENEAVRAGDAAARKEKKAPHPLVFLGLHDGLDVLLQRILEGSYKHPNCRPPGCVGIHAYTPGMSEAQFQTWLQQKLQERVSGMEEVYGDSELNMALQKRLLEATFVQSRVVSLLFKSILRGSSRESGVTLLSAILYHAHSGRALAPFRDEIAAACLPHFAEYCELLYIALAKPPHRHAPGGAVQRRLGYRVVDLMELFRSVIELAPVAALAEVPLHFWKRLTDCFFVYTKNTIFMSKCLPVFKKVADHGSNELQRLVFVHCRLLKRLDVAVSSFRKRLHTKANTKDGLGAIMDLLVHLNHFYRTSAESLEFSEDFPGLSSSSSSSVPSTPTPTHHSTSFFSSGALLHASAFSSSLLSSPSTTPALGASSASPLSPSAFQSPAALSSPAYPPPPILALHPVPPMMDDSVVLSPPPSMMRIAAAANFAGLLPASPALDSPRHPPRSFLCRAKDRIAPQAETYALAQKALSPSAASSRVSPLASASSASFEGTADADRLSAAGGAGGEGDAERPAPLSPEAPASLNGSDLLALPKAGGGAGVGGRMAPESAFGSLLLPSPPSPSSSPLLAASCSARLQQSASLSPGSVPLSPSSSAAAGFSSFPAWLFSSLAAQPSFVSLCSCSSCREAAGATLGMAIPPVPHVHCSSCSSCHHSARSDSRAARAEDRADASGGERSLGGGSAHDRDPGEGPASPEARCHAASQAIGVSLNDAEGRDEAGQGGDAREHLDARDPCPPSPAAADAVAPLPVSPGGRAATATVADESLAGAEEGGADARSAFSSPTPPTAAGAPADRGRGAEALEARDDLRALLERERDKLVVDLDARGLSPVSASPRFASPLASLSPCTDRSPERVARMRKGGPEKGDRRDEGDAAPAAARATPSFFSPVPSEGALLAAAPDGAGEAADAELEMAVFSPEASLPEAAPPRRQPAQGASSSSSFSAECPVVASGFVASPPAVFASPVAFLSPVSSPLSPVNRGGGALAAAVAAARGGETAVGLDEMERDVTMEEEERGEGHAVGAHGAGAGPCDCAETEGAARRQDCGDPHEAVSCESKNSPSRVSSILARAVAAAVSAAGAPRKSPPRPDSRGDEGPPGEASGKRHGSGEAEAVQRETFGAPDGGEESSQRGGDKRHTCCADELCSAGSSAASQSTADVDVAMGSEELRHASDLSSLAASEGPKAVDASSSAAFHLPTSIHAFSPSSPSSRPSSASSCSGAELCLPPRLPLGAGSLRGATSGLILPAKETGGESVSAGSEAADAGVCSCPHSRSATRCCCYDISPPFFFTTASASSPYTSPASFQPFLLPPANLLYALSLPAASALDGGGGSPVAASSAAALSGLPGAASFSPILAPALAGLLACPGFALHAAGGHGRDGESEDSGKSFLTQLLLTSKKWRRISKFVSVQTRGPSMDITNPSNFMPVEEARRVKEERKRQEKLQQHSEGRHRKSRSEKKHRRREEQRLMWQDQREVHQNSRPEPGVLRDDLDAFQHGGRHHRRHHHKGLEK
ncbi:hypothetical protein BESB_000510 [Besnoitia besnoiti]|uniref:Uncharacterized protein n=1 Tax=Besnoitia besnoiti TaxID=94643 RepID=A0A2A9MIH8_BESBE|nr:hypothetical protein BESB_000510 [Besnoitia besnoiti]PFH37709.1 hypothetical protein BESB_000510 [Besnoitia besnoiti]